MKQTSYEEEYLEIGQDMLPQAVLVCHQYSLCTLSQPRYRSLLFFSYLLFTVFCILGSNTLKREGVA
jgi:hypothetical protein